MKSDRAGTRGDASAGTKGAGRRSFDAEQLARLEVALKGRSASRTDERIDTAEVASTTKLKTSLPTSDQR